MKRDLELIKQILIEAEGEEEPDYEEYTTDQIQEHKAYLIEEEELLRGGVTRTYSGPPIVMIEGLTKEGHAFLVASRENKAWEWLKANAGDKVAGMALASIQALLVTGIQELKNRLGAP